ncbi:hypothetical protein [Lacinutrix himadriensis]|uniref:hypothetical protein n=1 Tax=Lacinutrix himadriensis TaxID=641549 RepID=UPI0006E23ED2|nr:hypothetical protein [Lacinutrix himadriensis]
MEYAKHEIEYINEFKEKGYTSNFRMVDSLLLEINSKEKFKPEQIFIDQEMRFEGMSNPSDASILYAIKTDSGLKGTVLASYAPTGNLDLAEFFKEIPKSNNKNH